MGICRNKIKCPLRGLKVNQGSNWFANFVTGGYGPEGMRFRFECNLILATLKSVLVERRELPNGLHS